MSRVDFAGEFKVACDALEKRGWDCVARYGFTKPIIAAIGFAGLARVMVDDDAMLYEPSEDGPAMVILPVFAGEIRRSDIVDLAAWHPREPESLYRRAGLGFALGEDALRQALDPGPLDEEPGPLSLYRTPADWGAMRAAGRSDGAVLLTWREPKLLQLREIVAEDVAHGDFIKKKLTRLRAQLMESLPRIRVPEVEAGGAAV